MSTILITGATSGIGLEAAVALARRGNRVVLVGRDQKKMNAAVDEVKRFREGSLAFAQGPGRRSPLIVTSVMSSAWASSSRGPSTGSKRAERAVRV